MKYFTKKIIALISIVTLIVSNFGGMISYAKTSDNVVVENTYIRSTVNSENGRFSIRTVNGSPNRTSDLNKKLLFEEVTPETSFTTFQIDGEEYIYGNTYNHDGLTSEFIEEPKQYGDTNYSKWRIGDVYISQYLIVENEGENAGDVRVKYEVKNNSSGTYVYIGSRILLDTMIGENDGAPIRVPTTDDPVNTEQEFTGDNIPYFWYGVDRLNSPTVVGKGTLGTGRYPKPDKFVIAHWGGIQKTKWDYEISRDLNITNDDNEYGTADSAVAIYWNPIPIYAQETKVFTTTYGIGDVEVSPTENFIVGLTSSTDQLDVLNTYDGPVYSPNPFEFVAYIDNTLPNSKTLNNVEVELMLPSGKELELVEGSNKVVIETLEKDTMKQITFKVKANPLAESKNVLAYLKVKVDDKIVANPGREVTIPKLDGYEQITYMQVTPNKIFYEADEKKVCILGEGFDYINEHSNLTITTISDKKVYTTIEMSQIEKNSDRSITVTLPDLDKGYYDLMIKHRPNGEYRDVIKTFEDAFEITDNAKIAPRNYPDLELGNLTIKGNLSELDGVYTTFLDTKYVLNGFVKFEGEMKLNKLTKEISGNGRFYVDLNASAGVPKVTVFDGDFELVDEEDALALVVKSDYFSPLFRDVGISWPVKIGNLKLLPDGIRINGNIGVEFMGLNLDLLSAGGATIEEIDIKSSGVDFKGEIAIESPFKAGPLNAGSVELGIDTREEEWSVKASVPMPSKGASKGGKEKELSLLLEFVNWDNLNTVEVSADVQIKLSPIPAEIANITGGIENLADTGEMPTIVKLNATITDSVSPEINGYRALNYNEAGIELSEKFMRVSGEAYFYCINIGRQEAAIIWDSEGVKDYDFEGITAHTEMFLSPFWQQSGGIEFRLDENNNPKMPTGKLAGSLKVPDDVPIIGGTGFEAITGKFDGSKITAMLDCGIADLEAGFDFSNNSVSFNTNPNFIQIFEDVAGGMVSAGEFLVDGDVIGVLGDGAGAATDAAKDAVKGMYSLGDDAFGSIDDVWHSATGWISGIFGAQYIEYGSNAYYNNNVLAYAGDMNLLALAAEPKLHEIYPYKFDLTLTGDEESIFVNTNLSGLDNIAVYDPNWTEVPLSLSGENKNALLADDGTVSFVINNPVKGDYKVLGKQEGFRISHMEVKISPKLTSVTALNNNDGTVTVTWNEENDLEDTTVKLMLTTSLDASSGIILSEKLPSTGSATVTLPDDLESGVYYILADVERTDAGFDFKSSNPFNFTNPKAPKAPTGFTGKYIGNGNLEFNWNLIEDNDSIESYIVYRINLDGNKDYFEVDKDTNKFIGAGWDVGLYEVGVYATAKVDETIYIGDMSNVLNIELSEAKPPKLSLSFTSSGKTKEKFTSLSGEDFVQYFLNDSHLTLKGTSDMACETEIYINDEVVNTISGKDISHTFNFTEDGEYEIKLVSTNEDGDSSKYYYNYFIDTESPYLEVKSPINGDAITSALILVQGQAEPSTTLKVNGRTVEMDKDGNFRYELLPTYSLSNEVIITSEDYAGNKTVYEAWLVNETHEVKSFGMTAEKETMYVGSSQIISGMIVDILNNENLLAPENVKLSIIEGSDLATINADGQLTANNVGKVTIRGVFSGSDTSVMEEDITINIIPVPSSSDSELGPMINQIFSKRIDSKNGGVIELGTIAKVTFPAGSISESSRFEAKLIDPTKEKLPESFIMKLESQIIEINTAGNRRFNKPIELTFEYEAREGTNPENYGVYYFNEEQGLWLFVGGEVNADGTINAKIGHLTKFAVFYNENIKKMNDIENHWSKDYVKVLVGRNIITGAQNIDGTYNFLPNNNITRAEFAKLVTLMYNLEIPQEYYLDFEDVDEIPSWSIPYVAAAYKAGIINGVTVGNKKYIKANDYVTREQIVAMLGRGYDYEPKTELNFTDNDKISDWSYNHLRKMVELGIIGGYPEGDYRPQNLATRGEAAKIIHKTIEILESE